MSLLDPIRRLVGLPTVDAVNEDLQPRARAELPGGLAPDKFVKLADQAKSEDYAGVVCLALRYYRGTAALDTLWVLRKAFPKTADRMTPVSVEIVQYIINKQATVFSGEPDFDLQGPDEKHIVGPKAKLWQDVITRCELQRHAQQANRLTRLCKRSFARVTWNVRRNCPRIVTFTPDQVHVLFAPDATDLNEAKGVMLDIAPAMVGDRKCRRWEFWSAGDGTPGSAKNFIVDDRGEFSGIPDENGVPQFDNPYLDDNGVPFVPIISFADEDVSVGYWVLPRMSLLAAQQAIDVDQTILKHVARKQGFGVWISSVNQGEQNPEEWSGEPTLGPNAFVGGAGGTAAAARQPGARWKDGESTITIAPDAITSVPIGRKLENVAQHAHIPDQVAANDRYLKQLLTTESIPPGEMMGEPSRVSGVALAMERMGLMELRRDQISLYQHPTEELINVVRLVWDAHQPDNSTRLGPLTPHFTADDVSIPIDPAVQIAQDTFALKSKLVSRIELIARDRDVDVDTARQIAADIDKDSPSQTTAADVAASLRARSLAAANPDAPQADGDNTEPKAGSLSPGSGASIPPVDPAVGAR